LTVSLADPLDQVADDLSDELGILPVQVVATMVCHDMCAVRGQHGVFILKDPPGRVEAGAGALGTLAVSRVELS
jgi:hypothetical protein